MSDRLLSRAEQGVYRLSGLCHLTCKPGRFSPVVFLVATLAVASWSGLPALAGVRLSALFSDNLVLQRDVPVPVWGTAEPAAAVSVVLGECSSSTVADARGEWLVRLGPLKAGGPYELTVASPDKTVIRQVMVGEVWIASGQSNMAMPLSLCQDGAVAVAQANRPEIRFFLLGGIPASPIPAVAAADPQKEARGRWQVCTPENAGGLSGVAYYFACELQASLKVPIGLIVNAVSGTPAEAWMPRACLEAEADFRPILDHYEKALPGFPERQRAYEAAYAAHKADLAAARAVGKAEPRPPLPPFGPGSKFAPFGLFNGRVQPLIPYAIRGVIWYQGENNTDRGWQYRKLFPALIACWRDAWGQGDFPFLFVQLANYAHRQRAWCWPELREAQLLALSQVPNTGMAVTIDIGDTGNVHPKNKQDVGHRLALAARAVAYGERIVFSGPLYERMSIEGSRVRLHFRHVGSGLCARGDDRLQGFTVAGADRRLVPADAAIDGDTVVVSAANVTAPVAVRYGWDEAPVCNLGNRDGLPASPFRTDTWEAKTVGVHEPTY